MKAKINNIAEPEVAIIAKSEYHIGDIVYIRRECSAYTYDIDEIVNKCYVRSDIIYGLKCNHNVKQERIIGKLEPINKNYRLSFEDGQIYVDLIDCPIDMIKPKKTNEPVKNCNCKCDCDNASKAPESLWRLSKDEYYINIAKAVSKRSTCLRRQYGAVIINNDEIVSTGYNGSPRGEVNCCDTGICKRLDKPHNSGDYFDCHSVHAEQNAIISASRKEMIGATLYLYGEEDGETIKNCVPCPVCSRMIKNSGIVRIVSTRGEIKL